MTNEAKPRAALNRLLSEAMVAAVTGVITAVMILLYQHTVETLTDFSKLLHWTGIDINVINSLIPIPAMLLTGWILQRFSVPSPSMADEIIDMYHRAEIPAGRHPTLPKLAASFATLCGGCSAGLEGASKWLGGMIGWNLQKFLNSNPSLKILRHPPQVTLLAGAAAGISTVFRAPLTGSAMTLESPRQHSLEFSRLLPCMVAALSAYCVYRHVGPLTPLLTTDSPAPLGAMDFTAAAGLGVVCGLWSRLFKSAITVLKNLIARANRPWAQTYLAGGFAIATTSLLCLLLTGQTVVLGSGLREITELLNAPSDERNAIFLFAGKSIATAATFAFGGVGGLFLPSATIGAALGALTCQLTGSSSHGAYALAGAAAFTGAGYSSFLFSLLFVAEASGRPDLLPFAATTVLTAYLAAHRRIPGFRRPKHTA